MDFLFDASSLGLILAIAVVEALFSVDNALANASIAQHLPQKKRGQAIAFGIFAGAGLRIVALFCAGFIMAYPVVKLFGAAYLLYLFVKHFFFSQDGEGATSDHGKKLDQRFWRVIGTIAVTDLAFSIDNVVAAVGMSPHIEIVIIGVLVGIITMIFATQLVVVLLKRYPLLEHTAFLIIGLIGLAICVEEAHLVNGIPEIHVPDMVKFVTTISLVVGTILMTEASIAAKRRTEKSVPAKKTR